ncbi:2-oxoglutarate dehydrogenase E1 component [Arachis hypogaea]|uniref:2-oxoglutarate dehydrogenase E1 component n=1 Tax=Arachis hypogaea TaxID=3818 RepID=A0A6B9V9V3_ARAHY|nr:2-oxoglutarate dehydrogenase E1 component [Arachis hypogaea]
MMDYLLKNPNSLVIWEVHFGDFTNGAHVIFDISCLLVRLSGSVRLGLSCYFLMVYDGQGLEHSSARLECFLQECNLQIVNVTTPANFFHVFRRQVGCCNMLRFGELQVELSLLAWVSCGIKLLCGINAALPYGHCISTNDFHACCLSLQLWLALERILSIDVMPYGWKM